MEGVCHLVAKRRGSRHRRVGLECPPFDLQTLCPWAGYEIYQGVHLLSLKMGLTVVSTQGCGEQRGKVLSMARL